jgi:hypothetical protein
MAKKNTSNILPLGVTVKQDSGIVSTIFKRSSIDGFLQSRVDTMINNPYKRIQEIGVTHKGMSYRSNCLYDSNIQDFPGYVIQQTWFYEEYNKIVDKELHYNYKLTSQLVDRKLYEENLNDFFPEDIRSVITGFQKMLAGVVAFRMGTTSTKANQKFLDVLNGRLEGYTFMEKVSTNLKKSFDSLVWIRFSQDDYKNNPILLDNINNMNKWQSEIIYMYGRMALESEKHITLHQTLMEYGYNPFTLIRPKSSNY